MSIQVLADVLRAEWLVQSTRAEAMVAQLAQMEAEGQFSDVELVRSVRLDIASWAGESALAQSAAKRVDLLALGARETNPGEFPESVALGVKTSLANVFGCSGVLLTPTIILSATHCGEETVAFAGLSLKNVDPLVVRKVSLIATRDDFVLYSVVGEPFPLTTTVTFAGGCVLDPITVTPVTVGFGSRDRIGASRGTQRVTEHKIKKQIDDVITAGNTSGASACGGDSGGPLEVVAGSERIVLGLTMDHGEDCVGDGKFRRITTATQMWVEEATGVRVPSHCPGQTAVPQASLGGETQGMTLTVTGVGLFVTTGNIQHLKLANTTITRQSKNTRLGQTVEIPPHTAYVTCRKTDLDSQTTRSHEVIMRSGEEWALFVLDKNERFTIEGGIDTSGSPTSTVIAGIENLRQHAPKAQLNTNEGVDFRFVPQSIIPGEKAGSWTMRNSPKSSAFALSQSVSLTVACKDLLELRGAQSIFIRRGAIGVEIGNTQLEDLAHPAGTPKQTHFDFELFGDLFTDYPQLPPLLEPEPLVDDTNNSTCPPMQWF